jgi:PAS domain S-box-containing protein
MNAPKISMNTSEQQRLAPQSVRPHTNAGELISKESHFSHLANQAPVMMWITDADANCIFLNTRWYEYTGQTPSTALNRGWLDAVHPDDRQDASNVFGPQECHSGDAKHEYRLRSKDGEFRWMLDHGSPRYDLQGNFQGYIGTVIDIHERKLSEEKVKASENMYRQLIKSLPTAYYTCNAEGYIDSFNDAAVELWGREPELGKEKWCGPVNRYADVNGQGSEKNIQDQREELFIERADGARRNVLLHSRPVLDEHGKVSGVINMAIDITDIRRIEKALVESELRFRKLVDNLPVSVYVADADGKMITYNEAAIKMWGKTPTDETRWCGVHRLFTTDGDIVSTDDYPIARAFREKRSFVEEAIIEKPNGEIVFAIAYPSPIYDSSGECIGAMSVAVDITDRKKAEKDLQLLMFDLERRVDDRTQELKRSNDEIKRTNKELEQFAYIASHDLQEPLRKIQTFLGLIRRSLSDADVVGKYLEKVEASAKRMSSLIKGVLHYSRISKTNSDFVNIDLSKILEAVKLDFELLIEQREVTINTGKLPVIKGLPLQLNQLFSNLISNSIKFCEQKPVINISARGVPEDEKKALGILSDDLDYVQLCFADNGIGFDEAYSDQIFTIFQRLNERDSFTGTGIGLALCKKIVENHDGLITARSEEGKGSTFNIYLPVSIKR